MASRHLGDAHPDLIEVFAAIKDRFERNFPGFELRPTCTYRSPQEQNEAFKAGRSRIDGVTKKGPHNHKPSRAIDVGIFHKGEYLDTLLEQKRITKEQHIAMYWCIGLMAQKRGFRVGSDWNGNEILVGPDPAESLDDPYHIEMTSPARR